MILADIIWPPYPYEAGFCITDDPDASTLMQTQAVYDFLIEKSFFTTKAVWTFEPESHCGIPPIPDSALRGITLADKDFLSYCKKLHSNGFELCLHGASAGNNKREKTQKAIQLFKENFGPLDTFICHSKNADNIYWEEKTTSLFPIKQLLSLYSKHTCSGEIPESPFYWGDLSISMISQIRLYRTRYCNTLRRNPSMPYYDLSKPLVNGWFSATKRALWDCAEPAQLEQLKKENGLTVLYQYLHRYADPITHKLDQRFVQSINRLSNDSKILIQTVSSVMKRLRQIQCVFVVFHDKSFWLINTCNNDVENLQIKTDGPISIPLKENGITNHNRLIVVKRLPGKSIKHVNVDVPISFSSKNSKRMGNCECVIIKLPFGKLMVNLSPDEMRIENKVILPNSFLLESKFSGTGFPILSTISVAEEYRLLIDQISLITREILFKGRSLSVEKYLDTTREIVMEDHSNW